MTPKFTKTSVRKNENLGEKLSKKRASLGYDIRDVERAIKVRAKHIEYIENSQWEKLPPDVYVRGFLKSYARFLRLNPDKVIILYLKEKGVEENVSKATKKDNTKIHKPKTPKVIITPKKLTIASFILIATLVIGYIGWQVSILAAPPKLEIKSPTDNVKITDDSVIVEGLTDAGADVFINNVPIGVTPEGSFKENVSLQEGVNLIKIKAINRLERETEVTRTIVADLAEIETNGDQKDNELTMKIKIGPGSTSLYVEVDGKAVSTEEDNIMLAGSTQIIKAKKTITLNASNAGSVRIILNNKDLGTLGKSEKEVKKTYTLEDI